MGTETVREHASDCAVHNAPALPPGPCSCAQPPPAPAAQPEAQAAARTETLTHADEVGDAADLIAHHEAGTLTGLAGLPMHFFSPPEPGRDAVYVSAATARALMDAQPPPPQGACDARCVGWYGAVGHRGVKVTFLPGVTQNWACDGTSAAHRKGE